MKEAPKAEDPPEKVVFANHLRGLAALLVVATHLLRVYFHQDLVARALGAEPLPLQRPAWTEAFFSDHFAPGPLAVGIFFLLSGFVIPFSLKRLPPGPFLVSRAMRIYPTYWACLALGLLAIRLSGGPGELESRGIACLGSNALLLHSYLNQPSLDLVNWTLAIEVQFYLLAALLGQRLGARSFLPAATFSLAALGLTASFSLHAETETGGALRALATDAPYLIFLLIGTLFYKHHHGLLSAARLSAQTATLLGLFTLCWRCSPTGAQAPVILSSYFYALLVFAAAYAFRHRCAPWRPLDWLAAISYPLYAVHELTGFAILQGLIGSGWSYSQSLPVALVSVFGLAYLLHRFLERPTQTWGKRWAQKLTQQGVAREVGSNLQS